VKTSIDRVIKVLNMSEKIRVEDDYNIEGIKMALEDCKDLLQFVIHKLEASGVLVEENKIR